MNWNQIFIDDNRLRPIWRFFLSVVLLYFAFIAVMLLNSMLPISNRGFLVAAFWQSLIGLGVILASFKIMTAVFDHCPLASVGLAFHPRWWRELCRGGAVGAAMLLVSVGLECVCGSARFAFTPHPMGGTGCLALVVFALAAANEEAVFRGYPFQRLTESITALGAVAVSCVLFGIAHLSNPHRTWISTVNTALVGVPFCVAYLRTRALWLPVGMHFVWNFLLSFFLGLPVSGLTLPVSVLTARVRGPIWLTGGQYGPEGGLLATAAIIAAAVYLLRAKSIYTTEEMKTLAFAPATSPWREPPISILSVRSDEEVKKG